MTLAMCFFSDSGSVGVEVALKMAIQFWKNEGYEKKHKIISLKNGYHGDTFKAMEVSNDSDFSAPFGDVLHRGFLLDTPEGGFFASDELVKIETDKLYSLLKAHASEIACFILEPIVQCAGGFKIYSPAYLVEARKLCSHYNVLLIFDEVATGFGRTGKMFAAEHAGVSPDIMVIGKAMTAGYVGHAATLASTKVFNGFLGDNYSKALMHGPTFMGNPLACAIALKSISIFKRDNYLTKIVNVHNIISNAFADNQSPFIVEKRVLGAIGAIELQSEQYLLNFNEFSVHNGVWLRPIGKVLYLTPPYIINENELLRVLSVMKSWIQQLKR